MPKIPSTVYAEMTPNPKTMKFVANRNIVNGSGTVEFFNKAEARKHSPLADDLFNFPFIDALFFTKNFVTVSQNGKADWDMINMQLREFIRDYLEENEFAVNSIPEQANSKAETKAVNSAPIEPSELDAPIIQLLDEYVRPAVEGDGGAIDFKSYKDGIVTVILKGACSGCPSSTATLKGGIEQLLKSKLPQVTEVVAEEG